MNAQTRSDFIHLFERVGEPLYFSPRGRNTSTISYTNLESTIACEELRDAAQNTRRAFASQDTNSPAWAGRSVRIEPLQARPDLTAIGALCPRTALYNYFNPNHRNATNQLRKMFLDQQNTRDLLSMCASCRDSPMVNCKLWVHAMAGAMLVHKDTRNLQIIPATWEMMPDQFFPSFTIREAFRQSALPEKDRAMISLPLTGRHSNPENRLAYFREDVGVNSHHWHWHLIYRLEDPQMAGRRKGEMFYYMHHAMIARYDIERLSWGMHRVRALDFDDKLAMKEGYYGKLTDPNSARTWGTRQNDTPLVNLNRRGDTILPSQLQTANLADLRKMRDRVFEAIDTGMVITEDNRRIPLNIDILGDMVEASEISPNRRIYGQDGLHNTGHVLIAYAHDPNYDHFENGGPMSDTTTAMRDPIFYRWHKYIDIVFDLFKITQQPYQDKGGEFPLAWPNIQVTNVSVQTTNFGSQNNILRTYFMLSHADLSRGLDFLRIAESNLGGIWLEFEHLNHDEFNYTISVRNAGNAQVRATVRIYMAPRLDENGERFSMTQQRKLFIEMDKFVQTLRPGENSITRRSTESSVTIPWQQTFRALERSVELPTAQQSICGCGWPQHMLVPRGNAQGQLFDLVVFLTNAEEDAVVGATARPQDANPNCRESLSFCGRLGQPYPDKKPMGYPFDRNPFTIPDPNNPRGSQRPVENLDQYVSRIPNMRAIQIRIVHDASRPASGRTRNDEFPQIRRTVNGDPRANPTASMCTGGSPGSTASASSSAGRPSTMQTSPPRRPISTSPSRPVATWTRPPTAVQPGWGNGNANTWGGGQRSRSRSQSPQSPQGWTSLPRPGSPNWGWGG